MLKKTWLLLVMLLVHVGLAFGQVDVNTADQAALDGIKGIGPTLSKAMLDERDRGGSFSDWLDLERRVPGIGAKSSARLSQAGLNVNGQPRPPLAAHPKAAKKPVKGHGGE